MEVGTKRPGALKGALGLCFFLLLVPAVALAQPDPYEILASATREVNSGNIEAALQTYLKVPAPEPGEDGGAFVRSRMEAAKICFSTAEYEKSASLCEEILSLYPENLEAGNLIKQVAVAQTPKWLRFLKDMGTYFPTLLRASGMTILLVLITMVVSPVAGLFIALARISRVRSIAWFFWCYIWVFRGTPLLLQLFFIYYGLPPLGITLSPFTAAVLGLGLNYSAYLAEIMRGAIESIDAGQMEAAKSLGMTYRQAMRRIIVPQTYKRLVPPVGNEFIALIKDTALVSTIAMVELMRAADQIFNTTFNIFILMQAAMIYLVMTSIFTVSFRKLEDRLGVYENR